MFPLGANTTTTATIHLFATLEKCFTVQNKLIQSGKKLLRIRFKLNELSLYFFGLYNSSYSVAVVTLGA